MRLLAAGFLPLAGRVGIEFEDQLVRGVTQLPERHSWRLLGQYRVGLRGVLLGQEADLVLDDPYVHRVDLAGRQRRERPRQPRGDRAGEVDLFGGRQRGQVQLIGQLISGELRLAAARAAERPAAGGELPHRGHLRPRVAGFDPLRRGDDPYQLIIRTPRQPPAVLAGHRMHHGAQQRAGRHRVGFAVLREPGQVQLLSGQAHVQALLGRALPVILPPVFLRGRRQRGAVRLLGVARRAGEWIWRHTNILAHLFRVVGSSTNTCSRSFLEMILISQRRREPLSG